MTDRSGKQPSVELIHSDCLEAMAGIPGGSVDLICADLPYSVTACSWDSLIPFEPLWEHYRRVIKPDGAIVLTANQPFTSALITSAPDLFRYELIWRKSRATGFYDANVRPLRNHENILVFARGRTTYNPQKWQSTPYRYKSAKTSAIVGHELGGWESQSDGERFPLSVIDIPSERNGGTKPHPTQKPVALLEWLVRTYTNPGETVLDNVMGSGTAGVACLQTERNFIGIERDETYFNIARRRIADAQAQLTLTDGSGELESV